MSDKEVAKEPIITEPVTTARAPQHRRRRRVLACVALLSLFYAFQFWRVGLPNLFWWSSKSKCSGVDAGHGRIRPPHHARKPLFGKEAEKLFLSVPDEASATAASRRFASKPHMAGTDGDLDTAKTFLALLQHELNISTPGGLPIFPAGSHESRSATLGIPDLDKTAAWIDTYYPVMNSPLDRSVEIIGDDGTAAWQADLEEKSDDTDPDAGKYAEDVPAFHGLSVSGEAQGPLVYANYGRQEDYAALVAEGVNLTGAIVIARYGGIFRGLKVKGAQELGAAAVLIYSDPRDDGTVTPSNGYTVYPHGPARNPTSVQRGSVSFISKYPGDPTTEGFPSYENATRLEGTNYPSIPSVPISWANAEVLLKELGNGGRQVKVVNHVDDKVTPIWNVMGVIPGHIRSEIVVVGNHRDAWVLGATDPTSGTASVHEVVRGLGVLLKNGWKPLRTIVIASWDAEEYALIGSTEWGEDFRDFINQHVVAYINLDSSTSGSQLGASASPSLSYLYRTAAEEIPHPTDLGRSLWDARHDRGKLFGNGSSVDPEVQALFDAEIQAADSVGVSPLGSGSDYTVFLQYIGIASVNGGFKSTLHDPVYHYHSIFDSQRWQELYGDPGFFRHTAIAKHLGLMALRLSSSIVLPLNTTHYALELGGYLDKIESIASTGALNPDLSSLRVSIDALTRASLDLDVEKSAAEKDLLKILKKLRKRHGKLAKWRRKARKALCKLRKKLGHQCKSKHSADAVVAPPTDTKLKPRFGRYVGLLKEKQRAEEHRLMRAFAVHAGETCAGMWRKPRGPLLRKLKKAVDRVQAVNKKLVGFEKGFISEEGLKDRQWFKHLGVAPGKWLGYGATPMPAVEEALTLEKDASLAEDEAKRLALLIDRMTLALEA